MSTDLSGTSLPPDRPVLMELKPVFPRVSASGTPGANPTLRRSSAKLTGQTRLPG
ncbi:hypothetical protein [Arthrobacter sp. G119Y2]|uniref:hypothetical protein n=1 Tax=Arthrobacter sp. G119Y2 TaxID=3134965 RepID=UPI00311A3E7F